MSASPYPAAHRCCCFCRVQYLRRDGRHERNQDEAAAGLGAEARDVSYDLLWAGDPVHLRRCVWVTTHVCGGGKEGVYPALTRAQLM